MAKISKKEEKLLAQFAAMVGKDVDDLKAIKKSADPYPLGTKSMQLEAALHYIRQPQGYVARQCRECKEPFGSNYAHVAYCSDTCREKSWERDMKIPWNLNGKGQREQWGGEVPVLINPEVWKNIEFIIGQMQELKQKGLAQPWDTAVSLDDPEDSLEDQSQHRPDPQLEDWEPPSDFSPDESQVDILSEAHASPPVEPSESEPFGFEMELSSFRLD